MSTSETPGLMPGPSRPSISLQKGKHAPLRASAGPAANTLAVGDDRRRFQRVNVPLFGRFMRENHQEFPCQVVNVSPGGIAVRAPAVTEIGERIVLYLDTLGRIEGTVVRVYSEGFALKLTASVYKREKIANQLTWLVNRDRLSSIEDRRHDRIVPRKSRARLGLSDGSTHDCEILDISFGGAAVAVEPKPAIGEHVVLGLTAGRVVRHGDTAISIEFLEFQDPASLERQFG